MGKVGFASKRILGGYTIKVSFKQPRSLKKSITLVTTLIYWLCSRDPRASRVQWFDSKEREFDRGTWVAEWILFSVLALRSSNGGGSRPMNRSCAKAKSISLICFIHEKDLCGTCTQHLRSIAVSGIETRETVRCPANSFSPRTNNSRPHKTTPFLSNAPMEPTNNNNFTRLIRPKPSH